ncbi:MAG TPA: hypothetical protein VN840_15040 [Streptosporangiaceae bacterium]|nr:hypothetical protein [Streptosporangiaceae bacterium]
MYCSGPPSADGSHGGPLWLNAAARRVFDGSSAAALDPNLRGYLSDMVRPYGLTLRQDLLDQGSGQSYGEMAGALLAETVPAGQPVDLIVLAFANHDVIPGRSTAAYLSHLFPGNPMAFAVCDAGSAAPFTALQLIRAYTRSASCRRALLVVVEQAAVHYDLPAPAALPARHAAVTLLFGESGPGRLDTVRLHPGVDPLRAADLLAGELTALSQDRDVTLVAGNGLASLAQSAGHDGRADGLPGSANGASAALPAGTSIAGQVLVAPPGQPCTGVWWELAGLLTTPTAGARRVLLADYEPMLRYLCLSAIDVEASQAAAAPPLTVQQAQ